MVGNDKKKPSYDPGWRSAWATRQLREDAERAWLGQPDHVRPIFSFAEIAITLASNSSNKIPETSILDALFRSLVKDYFGLSRRPEVWVKTGSPHYFEPLTEKDLDDLRGSELAEQAGITNLIRELKPLSSTEGHSGQAEWTRADYANHLFLQREALGRWIDTNGFQRPPEWFSTDMSAERSASELATAARPKAESGPHQHSLVAVRHEKRKLRRTDDGGDIALAKRVEQVLAAIRKKWPEGKPRPSERQMAKLLTESQRDKKLHGYGADAVRAIIRAKYAPMTRLCNKGLLPSG